MKDVEISFVREGVSGVVAVGNYLSNAMRQFGIRIEPDCDNSAGMHNCEVTVTVGEKLLSPVTAAELKHWGDGGRKAGVRLACQAQIVKTGEIVVMTKENKEEPKTESRGEQFRKEFTELPLEQKISELVRLEAIALGETFSFILNSPLKVFEKVGDVMAEFGKKLENEDKKATRPAEHCNGAEKSAGEKGPPKKGGSKKKAS